MGVDISQYRATIGTFTGLQGLPKRPGKNKHDTMSSLWIKILMIRCLIAICMDVHPHPGPTHLDQMNICHLNIRSLNADKRLGACVTQLADEYDIITMSETWLDEDDIPEIYAIPGYTGPYRLDRTLQRGGGVLAWVRDTIVVKVRPDLHQDRLETLWLELLIPKHKLLLAICYRQQDGQYSDNYWTKLQQSYDLAKATGITNIILIGDFNADISTNRPAGLAKDAFLAINHLSQHINEPTRYHHNTGSVLDLIITNKQSLIKGAEVIAPVHLNDHCTIAGVIDLPMTRPKSYKRRMWSYKTANFDHFRTKLNEVDWEECLASDDPDLTTTEWTEKFLEVVNNEIPHKDVTVRPAEHKWYNGYLRKLCRKQRHDHKLWTQHQTPWAWERYRTSRNKYHQEVDRLRQEYEESLAKTLASETRTNPKKWWAVAKETMGNRKSSSIPSMMSNNEVYKTDEDKAKLFNDYFLEVQSLPNQPDNPIFEERPEPENTIEMVTIIPKDVEDVLKCLDPNKAYGPDGISPKMLKEGGPAIVNILTKLFNLSLAKGIFPSSWKMANVCPILKKAEEFFTKNYRPISLLSTIAKVFEKVVFKHLFNFFRTNFTISLWQSGFLPGHSCVTQLIEIYDEFCKAVDNGKEIRVVFLDISKAFDRVWHAGLLDKLKGSGIRGRLLLWLKSYLTDRQQRVTINGARSPWGKILAGVPQGSVLCPLLFLIFINDITHVIRRCNIRLFADDTCLFIEVDEPTEAADILNQNLQQIQEWADKWLVSFSPPKTKELLISNKAPRDHPPLVLNNERITRVKHHKHLGIYLSDNLGWKKHAEETANKANRCLGILRPLKFILDCASLETLYKSFVRPILEYADIVWDAPDAHRHGLDILERVQTEAARIVTGATARCSTENLYKEAGWEKLSLRRRLHRSTMMFKIMTGLAPESLLQKIPNRVEARTRYRLRNRGDIQVPFTRLVSYTQSFFPTAVRLWNEFTNALTNSPSVAAFKYNYLKATPRPRTNPLVYRGERREAVSHSRMRIGCSGLNADLCRELHVLDSAACTCPSGDDETADHYLLHCEKYRAERHIMITNLAQLEHLQPNCELLLHGDPTKTLEHNTEIFKQVHQFIKTSKRFAF
jgi:hypothetical protein